MESGGRDACYTLYFMLDYLITMYSEAVNLLHSFLLFNDQFVALLSDHTAIGNDHSFFLLYLRCIAEEFLEP